jgi:hypothetical protein
MLRSSNILLRGGGWSVGRSHKQDLSYTVTGSTTASNVFKQSVYGFAKKSNILKKTYLSSFYELPSDKRNRQRSERVYFKKWHFLKNASMIVKNAVENNLEFGHLKSNRVVEDGLCLEGESQEGVKEFPRMKPDSMTEQEIMEMALNHQIISR